jgi:AcrR family transcriptional regulator
MTTLEKIHAAAKREFLDKGFRAASLRNIVKMAGVTTGAFYGYYNSKDKLFDALVRDQAEYVLRLFDVSRKNFRKLSAEEQTRQMTDAARSGMTHMLEYMYANEDVFRLLLLCSEGTDYEDFVHQLAEKETESSFAYIEALRNEGVPARPVNRKLVHIVSSGLLTAVFETIVHDMPFEEAREYLSQLERFHTAGWEELLGVKFGKHEESKKKEMV